MSLITIAETTPNPPIHIPSGSTPSLRGFYSQRFLDSDGVTVVMPGDGQSGFYYDIPCTVNGSDELVVPEFEIHTTDDGQDVQTSLFTGKLFIDGADASVIIFGYPAGGGWIISATLGTDTTWGQLDIFNQGRAMSILGTLATYLTAGNTTTLIRQLATELIETLALGGTLSANRVPRATTTNSLTNSQIVDNGTDVTIDTLNEVGFGDLSDNQNGSYINVDDTAGRANVFAGGESTAQYAGLAAVCGVSQSELYLQGSFGNGYNYGVFIDGVAKVGDGLEENNGTYLEIDDVNEWIKLHNLPTADPVEAGALWNDSGTLKISAG